MAETRRSDSPFRDQAAEQALGAVLGANPFVRLDPTELLMTAARVGMAAARPALLARHLRVLGRELAAIAAGRSEVRPHRGDRRFSDTTWTEMPLYRGLMQAYLAASSEVQHLIDDVPVDKREQARARFLATIVTEALAPTNLLAGNPAALKRTFETGGANLARGVRNWVGDLLHNGGMPRQVDTRPFVLGKTVAVSPGSVVYRNDQLELVQYRPAAERVRARPVVIIPPQINKFWVFDLAPGRSMVEYATSKGLQLFAISWRNPTPAERAWDLNTYVAACKSAIEAASAVAGSEEVNVLGACAGGITTACLLGHLAALGDRRVGSVTFLVTVLDSEAPSTVGMFASERAVAASMRYSRRKGILDGESLARVFAWLRPNDLVWNYWVNNYLLGNDPPPFDVLAWNADTTNLPAALHADFLSAFMSNALARPGTLEVCGTPIDLGKVEADSYVLGALTDHITPWAANYGTLSLLGGSGEFVLSSSGHIQALVNPPGNPKARYLTNDQVPGTAEEWLKSATEHAGSWWDHWLGWLQARSGDERPAPKGLGNRRFPPLDAAPGRYVLG
ncbi:MAG TPA: alpha/beta fold hydrolase [Actinomycetota bacterium]|nr:alpha/beta fold hydrolase [Actinomycetota bacterium]